MNDISFQSNTRSGTYKTQQEGYEAFIPAGFPPEDLDFDSVLIEELSRADRALARLDGVASVLPAVDLFIFIYIHVEATSSSQIEGTQATLVDVLEVNSLPEVEPRNDVQEISNYVEAMNRGIELLDSLPVGRRLIMAIHEILMEGVRGGDSSRTPGELRRSQNWIGGASPATARFVPPPIVEMEKALDEWESFVHAEASGLPPLIRIGLLHSQFETIHPFLDGNGRIGRLLITFLLIEEGILSRPLLFLSIFFQKHRSEYNSQLQAVRDEGTWESWLKFFLVGVVEVAEEAVATVQSILKLREDDRLALSALGARSGNALKLYETLFQSPVIRSREVTQLLGVTQPTADRFLKTFEELEILVKLTGGERGRVWIFSKYVDVFRRSETDS